MVRTYEGLAGAIGGLACAVSQCSDQCQGITHDRQAGILPRCVFLEPGTGDDAGSQSANGTVVVGLNPGNIKAPELRKVNELLDGFRKPRNALSGEEWHAFTDAYYAWLRGNVACSVPYYTLLRCLVRAAGRRGPILWTELVKCQSEKAEASASRSGAKTKRTRGLYKGHPSTVMKCTSSFLVKELGLAPKGWPILAAGADAFDWAKKNPNGHTIVGVPHPSGAAFQFLTLFAPLGLESSRFAWTNGKWHSAKDL